MHPLTLLAKDTVNEYVLKGRVISPGENLPKDFLKKRAGTFVSIFSNGRLRGCIGTVAPTADNIAEEVISNAISAARHDDRFGAVLPDELPGLSYQVYVLAEPEPVFSGCVSEVDPESFLSPGKYGILIKSAGRSSLLLPGLKGINSAKEQLLAACRKGRIDPRRESVDIYRFTAEKYE